MLLLNDSNVTDFSKKVSFRQVIEGARVIGVGESAHFVSEFSNIRMALSRQLIDHFDFNVIGLECSGLQGEKLNEWFNDNSSDADIENFSSPLSTALYGTVLTELKSYLRDSEKQIEIIGVDTPNTLSPLEDLKVLIKKSLKIDPIVASQWAELEKLLQGVSGGSAVNSSMGWTKLSEADQNRALSCVTRLRLRFEALKPLFDERLENYNFFRYYRSLVTVQYTLEALFGMSALFDGTALEGETSVRDYFMVQSVKNYLNINRESKLILLAHNNHIQKEPVVFSGELAGIPMGQYMKDEPGYRSIALTHLGNVVPEMDFPDDNSPVGFSVNQAPAAPIGESSIEKHCMEAKEREDDAFSMDVNVPVKSIRSQNATVDVDVKKAFDVVVYSGNATKDLMVGF